MSRPSPRTILTLLLVPLLWPVAWAPTPAIAQGATVTANVRTDPATPQGADGAGRVRMFAPNPLQGGSSVSHFDVSASPNLLMEPSNSASIAIGELDLTVAAMRDMAWPPGNAQITLRIEDGPNEGFNDPNLGADRRRAMTFAANRWAQVLGSGVEVNVGVRFDDLECGMGGGVLAQAGTRFIFESFPGAPVANTWFHGALAESLSGQNLSLQDIANATEPDLAATFNSDIDNGCLGSGSRYFYGLSGNVPQGQISFVNVALHELAHGLGFSSIGNIATGAFFQNLPDIYSRQLRDNTFGANWHQLTPPQRRQSAINDGNLVWSGNRVNNQARGFLNPGIVVDVTAPSSVAGPIPAAGALFGPPVTRQGFTGELVIGRDGSSQPTLGCNALVNGNALAGNIAVLDRGDCLFVEKVNNAENAGAVGVIIVNNVAGTPINLGGDDSGNPVRIPSVHVSQADGERLKRALTVGVPPDAPSDLTAQALSGGRVALAWQDNSDNEAAFRLERRRNNAGGFQLLANLAPDTTVFQDTGLTPGDTLTYRVSARNNLGGSPFSNEAMVTVPDLPPPPPVLLDADSVSTTEVALTWRRPPGDPERILVDARRTLTRDGSGALTAVDEAFVQVGESMGTDLVVGGLDPDTTYNFRLRSEGAGGVSDPSNQMAATTDRPTAPTPCVAGETTLCLAEDRFAMEVLFRNQREGGEPGIGQAVDGTPETGFFWFFRPDNLELVVKVLDARSFADAFWVFYGGLSDVEYWIVVTDTVEGQTQTYYNPPEEICGRADVNAFLVPPDVPFAGSRQLGGVFGSPRAGVVHFGPEHLGLQSVPGTPDGGTGTEPCDATESGNLCLFDDRFQVTVTWRDFRSGNTGIGTAIPDDRSDTSGFFWFFNSDNIELVTKIIDGNPVNDHFWFFYGALSDVEYTIRVVDTLTGNSAEYSNPGGNICGVGDTQALDGP